MLLMLLSPVLPRLGRALVTVGTNPRSNMGMAVVNPGVANLPPTLRTDLANK